MSHIYIKRNLNQKWRKHYLNGNDVSRFNQGNNWKSHSKIKWNTFEELDKQLLPFIKGTEANAEYCALMIGETEDTFTRNKENVKNEALDYLLLDIETDLPEYEDINTDLSKIKDWLISHYDWIKENTGMYLFFSNSAGVHCGDKHKQIRARAILKIDKALNEESRLNLLKDCIKDKESSEYNHIDAATLRRATASIIAPPLIEQTETNKLSTSSLVVEGKPVDTTKISTGFFPSKDKIATTETVFSQKTLQWFNQIEKGNTFGEKEGQGAVWKTVWSCVMRCENHSYWEQALVKKLKDIGSDRWKEIPREFDYANKTVKKWFFLHELNKDTKHNLIQLDKKYISEDGLINWKKNGAIHIKSGTGTGKTTALKKLIEDNPDKSILYIGKNIGYVRNAATTLGLDDYKDFNKFPRQGSATEFNYGLWKSERLSICYPSIERLHQPDGNLSKFDIVIIDEARQLLGFAATSNIIEDRFGLDALMGKLVANAELVVCCDADLDDLTVKAIEVHRGEDDCFDIYWNKFCPLEGKTAFMCRSPSELMQLASEIAKSGKTFALVGDFSPKPHTKYPIPRISEYLQAAGLEENQIFTLHGVNSQEGEQQDILCNPNKYLTQKLKDGLKVFIASPSLTSGWDYSNEEYQFDYVLGMYPHAILTAPEILQQLRRFRGTTEFYVWVKPNNQHTEYELNKLEDIWQDLYGYTARKFKEPVYELGLQQEKDAFNKREAIRISDRTGFDYRFKEITKATKASLCNLRLHFDMLWKEQGGNTQLSPYFDEMWKETIEGKETIVRDKKELLDFYEIKDREWEKIKQAIKKAPVISKDEYEKILTEY